MTPAPIQHATSLCNSTGFILKPILKPFNVTCFIHEPCKNIAVAYATTKDFHHEKAVEIFGNITEEVYDKVFFSD